MTDEKRKATNAERLLLVDTTIRKQVAAVLATMEHYGHKPLIAKEVWRDPALQLSMFRRGVSKLRWGMHCFTRNGKPASLAADIIDATKAWNASREFWLCLLYASMGQGLESGTLWGLAAGQKERLKALAARVTREKRRLQGTERVELGWDPAHIQTGALTVAQAKAKAS